MKTKEALADSFRELVLSMPFSKISIKMITDRAGVIRPTFYNYFQDKYEVIEYLFEKDIAENVRNTLNEGREQEAIKLMFLCFEKNMKYYCRLFETKGQNSFEEYFGQYIHNTCLNILKRHPLKQLSSDLITPEVIAHFNALILIEIIKLWLRHSPPISAEEMFDTYRVAVNTSILDMIDYPQQPD